MHVLGKINGQGRRLHQGALTIVGEVSWLIGLSRTGQVVLLQIAKDHIAVAQELLTPELRVRELIDSSNRGETINLSHAQELRHSLIHRGRHSEGHLRLVD